MLRLVLAIGLVAAPAAADPPDEKISIDSLVTVAVRRSSTLAFVRATRRLADLAVVTAGAGAEVQVRAALGADRKSEPSAAAGAPLAIESTNITGSLGLAKRVPTGGELSLAVASTNTSRTGTSDLAGANLGLDLRQPLLRGLAQGPHVEQQKAEIAAAAAKLQTADDAAALIRDLLSAYWELAFARASLAAREQSLQLAKSQLELTQKMHDRGTVPDSAIKSARYGVAVREEAKLRAKDAVQSASLVLRKLAGLEIAVDAGDLAPSDAMVTSTVGDDIEQVVADALAHNPRIAAARLGIQIADVDLQTRKNAVLPTLDVTASASVLGAGPDRGKAFEAIGKGPAYEIEGHLAFAWEIGGAASAAADSARIVRSNARLTAKEVERDVIADVIDSVHKLAAAKERANTAQRAIELALANLDTEVAMFKADKSSNVLVFQRETELDEARLLASRATADALIAQATLEYLTGTLLDRYGIEVLTSSKGARHARP